LLAKYVKYAIFSFFTKYARYEQTVTCKRYIRCWATASSNLFPELIDKASDVPNANVSQTNREKISALDFRTVRLQKYVKNAKYAIGSKYAGYSHSEEWRLNRLQFPSCIHGGRRWKAAQEQKGGGGGGGGETGKAQSFMSGTGHVADSSGDSSSERR
jgi:hypothetical protein